MKKNIIILSLVLAYAATDVAKAQDWPQMLGPNRNGISQEKNLLRSWPQSGPEVLWTANIGIGYGGPAVKDGKVYLLDRDDAVGDIMRCFDLNNGKELWSFKYDAPGTVRYPGSRSVPAIDGNKVYSVGHNGHLYCIDTETHKPVWNKNIWTDFGGTSLPSWAITQCPLIFGDVVIVASQAPQAGVVAYNKLTGELKWKTPSLGGTGYVSPSPVKIGSETHIVMISASARGGFGQTGSGAKVAGIDPLTGKILWEYTNFNCVIPVPSVIDAGENRIFVTAGYNTGSALIKVDRKADGSYGITELFRNMEVGAHTLPPVLYNNHFYMQCSTNEKKDGLVCLSMEGEVKWKTLRAPAFERGGMVLADGLILATDGTRKLYLIEPDPSAFKQISVAEILEPTGSQQNWAPLTLAGGKLLIRDQGRLVCVKVSK